MKGSKRACAAMTMTNQVRNLGLLLVAVFLFSVNSIAQDVLPEVPMATLTEEGVLVLPADQPLAEKYYFDMSHLEFANDMEMVDFLSDKGSDTYLLRAVPSRNQGVLMLQCKGRMDWTCQDWNAHLSIETAERPIRQ